MKSKRIYNHENAKLDQKFNNLIRNTPKLTAAQLYEESIKLNGEMIKRQKMERQHKRYLREKREAEEAALKEMNIE